MQPSDIMLINGAHGTGKTITCLNVASMLMKSSDEARVLLCYPNQSVLAGVLALIYRGDKYISNSSHLLNNLTIVA